MSINPLPQGGWFGWLEEERALQNQEVKRQKELEEAQKLKREREPFIRQVAEYGWSKSSAIWYIENTKLDKKDLIRPIEWALKAVKKLDPEIVICLVAGFMDVYNQQLSYCIHNKRSRLEQAEKKQVFSRLGLEEPQVKPESLRRFLEAGKIALHIELYKNKDRP